MNIDDLLSERQAITDAIGGVQLPPEALKVLRKLVEKVDAELSKEAKFKMVREDCESARYESQKRRYQGDEAGADRAAEFFAARAAYSLAAALRGQEFAENFLRTQVPQEIAAHILARTEPEF